MRRGSERADPLCRLWPRALARLALAHVEPHERDVHVHQGLVRLAGLRRRLRGGGLLGVKRHMKVVDGLRFRVRKVSGGPVAARMREGER